MSEAEHVEQPVDASVLSRAKRQKLKRQQREEERAQREEERDSRQKRKSVFVWSIVGIIAVGMVVLLWATLSGGSEKPYSGGQVHWHATLKVFVCGEERVMPSPFGNQHIGSPLMHTHEDRLIHIEGTVWTPEEITLGKYMEAIGQNFKDAELLEKKNGDLCGDTPGTVTLLVDGVENPELTRHVIKDGEKYELRFE